MAKMIRSDLRFMDGYRLAADLRFGIFRCAKWWEYCIQHPNGEWLYARSYCRLRDARVALSDKTERQKLLKKVMPYDLRHASKSYPNHHDPKDFA